MKQESLCVKKILIMKNPLNKKGIALFLVLWVLTLLSVIVGEFCYTMRTEVNITRNFKEETQAYYIAVAGLNTAIAELIKNEVMPKPIKPETEKEKSSDDESDENKIEWRINADIPAIPFANGAFKVKIGSESGKININKADPGILKMLLSRFELEENDLLGIIDSVLDWRDADQLHRLNGAEDDYYLSLSEPYECKDSDFDSIEELLLVKGITPELFYKGLKDVVTIYQDEEEKKKEESKPESKKKEFDFNRININTASSQMLLSLPQMTDDLVQEILEYRQENDFKSLSELIPIVGDDIFKEIVPYLSLQTIPIYTIQSLGTITDSHVRQGIQVIVKIDTTLKKKYKIIQWIDK